MNNLFHKGSEVTKLGTQGNLITEIRQAGVSIYVALPADQVKGAPEIPGVIREVGWQINARPGFVEIIRELGWEITNQPSFVEIIRELGWEA